MCPSKQNDQENERMTRRDSQPPPHIVRYQIAERRGSLLILTITILIVVVIVIAGVCAATLLEKHESQVIILWLIGTLVVVGIVAFAFLEVQRRRAARSRDASAADYVQQMIARQQRDARRSSANAADGDDNRYQQATWALTEPWRYSQRSTLKA